eukprot:gnl/Chilomastix_cuspidata/1942.p1 GENE.gnl/Chilomastix_cuspidata/1942~~gnl/Chilomastix_cuspidata/1942.p1  ORF type:complete len:357 (+),score=103.87 gnl/Chilomastix_cuspidata/1942:155-1225(+)
MAEDGVPEHLVRPTVIVNPHSRFGKTGKEWETLRLMMDDVFYLPVYKLTKKPGDAILLAKEAVEGGCRVIYSLGGDGTINEVVNGIMAAESPQPVTLGTLPAGTGSDTCRILDNASEFPLYLKNLHNARVAPVDVGCAEILELDDPKPFSAEAAAPRGAAITRYFLNEADIGLGGIVNRMVNASTKRHGVFLQKTISALIRARPCCVRIEADGELVGEFSIFCAFFSNGHFAGGGMTVAEGFADDGRLDMLLLPSLSRVKSILRSKTLYKGLDRIVEVFGAQTLRAREFVVTEVPHLPTDSEALRRKRAKWRASGRSGTYVDLDGETPGVCPGRFWAVPGRLRLISVSQCVLSAHN